MKKFIFVLFVLVTLAACADTSDMPMDASDTSYAEDLPKDTEDLPEDEVPPEPEPTPFNPGGRFCAEHLAESEVLTVYAPMGDRIIFDSIDDMIRFIAVPDDLRADIVRVEVLGERTAWHNSAAVWRHEGALPHPIWDIPDEYQPNTFYRVRVLEVFLGEFEVGDIIEVRQVGGQIDNVRLVSHEFLPMAPGDDLVLFLASLTWMPPSPAVLMAGSQAAYRFPDLDDGMRTFSADETLESMYEFPAHMADAELTLTIGDLMNLQIQNFGQVSENFAAMVR